MKRIIYHFRIHNDYGRVVAEGNLMAESAMGAREHLSFTYGARFINIEVIPAGEMVDA